MSASPVFGFSFSQNARNSTSHTFFRRRADAPKPSQSPATFCGFGAHLGGEKFVVRFPLAGLGIEQDKALDFGQEVLTGRASKSLTTPEKFFKKEVDNIQTPFTNSARGRLCSVAGFGYVC